MAISFTEKNNSNSLTYFGQLLVALYQRFFAMVDGTLAPRRTAVVNSRQGQPSSKIPTLPLAYWANMDPWQVKYGPLMDKNSRQGQTSSKIPTLALAYLVNMKP